MATKITYSGGKYDQYDVEKTNGGTITYSIDLPESGLRVLINAILCLYDKYDFDPMYTLNGSYGSASLNIYTSDTYSSAQQLTNRTLSNVYFLQSEFDSLLSAAVANFNSRASGDSGTHEPDFENVKLFFVVTDSEYLTTNNTSPIDVAMYRKVKVYQNGSWSNAIVRKWDGSMWVGVNPIYYNGSSWIKCGSYT